MRKIIKLEGLCCANCASKIETGGLQVSRREVCGTQFYDTETDHRSRG